jgi:hypothetical protein
MFFSEPMPTPSNSLTDIVPIVSAPRPFMQAAIPTIDEQPPIVIAGDDQIETAGEGSSAHISNTTPITVQTTEVASPRQTANGDALTHAPSIDDFLEPLAIPLQQPLI